MSFGWPQTLRTAERLLSRGKTTAAIGEYRKLVNASPTDLTTLNTLGDLCVRAGLNEEATRIFSRVASGYSHKGFTSMAIALLKKLLRVDPTDLDAAVRLAECYRAQGLRREAVRQYAEVAEAYERAGREDKALDAYQQMAEIDSSNTSLLMTLGERWQREGLRQRAHASFTAAGDEYSRQADEERAMAAYLKAQAALPDEHKTLATIASICAARGQVGTAIPILCDSLARNSSDAELHRILGFTYLSAGRLDDAERTFQKLLALDQGQYHNLLIVGEKFLETGDLDRAVEQIDGFVDSLIATRNEQEAVDFLRKVLERDPEHLASLKRLALIFRRVREDFNLSSTLKALADSAMRQGARDEAIEALKELCSLDPHEPVHGDLLRSMGVDAPAVPCAIYSAVASPWEQEAYEDPAQSNIFSIAVALARRGQTEEATALLRSVLRNEPDNLEARLALKNIYASVGSLDLAANEYLQIGRIRQATKALAAASHHFVPAGEIHGMSPFSGQTLPSGTNTDFELISAANRRQAARVSLRVPLVVISDAGGWREFTETIDVSEHGLRFKLAHPVAPMTELGILLDMSKWPATVAGMRATNDSRVIVRHCRQWPGEPNLLGVELWTGPQQALAATPLFERFTNRSGDSA